ncbi:MAG: CoxG family protein [Haloferacaceae archaeon]
MQFNGTFELEGASTEEVWLALSDPYMVKHALPGCQFLLEVEGEEADWEELRERAAAAGEDPETLPDADPEDVAARAFEEGGRYAALMELSVGSVSPSFETVVTITEREYPVMNATGEGSAANSSFEMDSGMTLSETDDGVAVEWWTEADVFGRIAQMGQRVLNPVANRVVNRFFGNIEDELQGISDEDSGGLRNRIKDMF